MKYFLSFIKVLLVIIAILVALIFITGNSYVFKGTKCTYMQGKKTANIDDHTFFENRVIKTSTPQPWAKHPYYNQIELSDTLRKELEDYKSIGFGVFKDGQILYEEYWDGYSDKSKTNSFSMAKSVVTMLLGLAIQDGYIKGLDQPITDFLPEYKGNERAEKCTIGDLSAMTSGYDWKEDYYLPLNPTAKAYYGTHLEKHILKRGFVTDPGGHFNYLSGTTQLLGIVLTRAIDGNISDYLSKKIWQPLGMEEDALWSLDRQGGIEKAYCCINTNVRDYAKLGQLLLQHGKWKGQQILDSAFVHKMVTPNYSAFNSGESATYGYSIWTDYEHQPNFFSMSGHLGQRIMVVPDSNLIIVRLGHHKDQRPLNKGILNASDYYYYMDGVIEMLDKIPK